MKKTFIAIVLSLAAYVASSQTQSWTYAPDSSSLSILLEGYKLDYQHKKFTLDLKGKWSYKNAKQLNVTLRGSLNTPTPLDKLPHDHLDLVICVFGKKYKYQAVSDGSFFTFEAKRPLVSIFKRPKFSVRSKKIKDREWSIDLDSIDMGIEPVK